MPQDLVNALNRYDPGELPRLALEAMLLFERHGKQAISVGGALDTTNEVGAVRRALIDLVDRASCCPTEVISALGALRDPDLIPLFRQCLSWQLAAQDAGGVYAAMIALDELGEKVFGGRQGASVLEWQVNRDLALAYLRRFPQQSSNVVNRP